MDLYANTVAHERARGAVKRYCQAAAESGSSGKSGGGGSDDEGGGGGGGGAAALAASLGVLRALAGSVPPGSSLEQMAATAPPWLRGKAGRERLTAARQVVAAAAARAAEQEGEEAVATGALEQSTAGAGPAAALPVPAGVAVSRSGAGGDSGGRGGRKRSAGLNPSQARAIETALGRSLTLWQG